MRGRRLRFAVAVAIGMATALAGCGSSGHDVRSAEPPPESTTTTIPAPTGLGPADPRITDRIELSQTTVEAGRSISGTLVVESSATEPINLNDRCRPKYGVSLENDSIIQPMAFTTECGAQPLLISPGTNRFPITIITTYNQCGGEPAGANLPCGPDNTMPALPPGTYRTTLYGSGDLPLPPPAPVTVTLT